MRSKLLRGNNKRLDLSLRAISPVTREEWVIQGAASLPVTTEGHTRAKCPPPMLVITRPAPVDANPDALAAYTPDQASGGSAGQSGQHFREPGGQSGVLAKKVRYSIC